MDSVSSILCHQTFAGRQSTAAFMLAALLAAQCTGCGKSQNHVALHPVSGMIQFKGHSPEGAFVSLVPKRAIDGAPAPRASVGKDGSFTVSTFNSDDGAPEGDYTITIQWYKPMRQGKDLVGGPNVLPPRYASPQTSDLTVHVAARENHLPPIRLR